LTAWKRVDRILRAAPEVLAVRPETLFVLSGEGPERLALEGLAEELSIPHAVRFVGGLPRDLNLRLIASADVFCALYDYSCVGVALLEALGCGIAETSETAAAITRLVNDHDLRTRLGTEARRRAEERFLTPQERASLELATIAELTGGRNPSSCNDG
jgi:glycosyltransferase involved in cell wall biosynthesis